MSLNNEDEILLLIDEDRFDSHERVTEVAAAWATAKAIGLAEVFTAIFIMLFVA